MRVMVRKTGWSELENSPQSLFPPIEALISTIQNLGDKQIISAPKNIEVQVEGVSIRGVVDTSSDITILSRNAFQEITTACGRSLNHKIRQPVLMVTIH